MRRAVLAVDPDQPVIELAAMEQVVEDRTAGVTFIANAMAVVAIIALILAVMGLYSLMAFVVSRRTQELGVRMALGATRWQVIGLTTRQGLKITVAGLAGGQRRRRGDRAADGIDAVRHRLEQPLAARRRW